MRFNRLDLNLLAALDILMETRSVSRAAEQMFITQSAMSSALNRMRIYFEDPLLVQVGRRMELSPLALTLRAPLREIMMQIETTTMLRPYFDPAETTREFSIVMSDYILSVMGSKLVRHVSRVAPNVCLNLRPQSGQPGLLLDNGDVDLVIAPEFIVSPNHESRFLFEDQLKVIACAEGPYGGGPLDLETFKKAPQVVMEPMTGLDSHSTVAMREAGIKANKIVSTYSFASIPHLLQGTDRIALVQERLARAGFVGGGLIVTDPPIKFAPLREVLQWRSHHSSDPGLNWLSDIIYQIAQCRPGEDMAPTG
ncbi:LysR family transcriptional regulator [Paracoccus sp. R86501]|uniref:LysR family transcriptional regulator n=1 Tax=Paracoccus sp. R86501 TaxID=3101711 RepID=UPI003672ED2B